MRAPDDVLLDYWPFVEFLGHVMRRNSDNFHATLVGLMIRFTADKCRQKRMVDIDDALFVLGGE